MEQIDEDGVQQGEEDNRPEQEYDNWQTSQLELITANQRNN